MASTKSPALLNLAVVIFGWVFLRLSILSLSTSPPDLPLAKSQNLAPAALTNLFSKPAISEGIDFDISAFFARPFGWSLHLGAAQDGKARKINELQLPVPLQGFGTRKENQPARSTLANKSVAQTGTRILQTGQPIRRWQLSGYALVRTGGGRTGIADNGQLGGSQFGLRAQRLLFRSGRLSLSANGRISGPVAEAIGNEAGIGLAIKRSGKIPVELIVERRVGLDKGGRNAVAALVATGFDDFHLPARLLLSGYVQAGFVGLKSRDGFVDGAIRAEHALLGFKKGNIRLGAVIAGSAQPGVARVDLGPTIAARFRVARSSVRVTAEWRERVIGNALPGSGPAITVGFDY